MANMSFFFTQEQFRNRTKTVTRRFAWDRLKVGQVLQAVEKSQGLKKGETVKALGKIRIVSITQERTDAILHRPDSLAEVAREGFPDMTPQEFVTFLCKGNKKTARDIVNRIEFEYVDDDQPGTSNP